VWLMKNKRLADDKPEVYSEECMSDLSTEPLNLISATDERRRHPRYRLSQPISVKPPEGSPILAITLEISEGGLSAVLASPVSLGGACTICSLGADGLPARVRRKIGKIYGFEFTDLTEMQLSRLREICRRLPRYPVHNRIGI
jgi:hypothetical protein